MITGMSLRSLVTTLLTVGSIATASHVLAQQPLDDFGQHAAGAFGAVAHAVVVAKPGAEPTLSVISIEEPGRKAPIVAAGPGPGGARVFNCEKSQMLALLSGQAGLAFVNIAECERDALEIRKSAEEARQATEEYLAKLPPQAREALRDNASWEKLVQAKPLQGYAYTLFVGGHGFATMNTVVLYDEVRMKAFVAQGQFDALCGAGSPGYERYGKSSPFCPRAAPALLEVAKRVASGR